MEYSARQILNLLSFLAEQETTTLHSSRVESRDTVNEATHILGKYMYTPFKLFIYLFSFIYLFNFIILYWFCHTLTGIHHGCTCVPHPETPSRLPPHPIPLGHPSAPVSSTLYHAPGLVVRFTYDNLHVSMPFSHIIPPLPSPTESKRLFYTSVSLLLSRIQVIVTIFLNSTHMR